MYKYLSVVLIIVGLQHSSSILQRNYNLEFYNFTCFKHRQNLKLFECDFMKTRTNSYLFNVRMMFGGKSASQFSLRFLIDVEPRSKNNTIRFIESTSNGCDEHKIKYDNPIIKFISQEIRRSGNLPYECPFKENFLYEVRNFSFTDNFLPTILPLAKFTVTVELRDESDIFASIIIKGTIVSKS